MSDMLIRQLKRIQTDMLKIFIEICEEECLRYFLIGGSCLGAIRHAGYIPWDDDIDVGMPREDYEKFSKIAKEKLPEHLFFQTIVTDPEYPNPFGKIRNSNTTYIEKSVKNLNINHGVYIDVFPIDGISASKFVRNIINFKKKIYNTIISQCFSKDIFKAKGPTKKRILKIFWKLNPNVKRTIQKREKLFCKSPYTSSAYVANFGGAWGEKEIMPKEIFGKGTKVAFEDMEVVVPEKYDEYLTRLYGDYMTPPPVEKRSGHHSYEIADMNKSYVEYKTKSSCFDD